MTWLTRSISFTPLREILRWLIWLRKKRIKARNFHQPYSLIRLKKNKIWLFKRPYRLLSRRLESSQMWFSQNSIRSKRRSKGKRKIEKFSKQWRMASLFHPSNKLMWTSSSLIHPPTQDLWILSLTRTNSTCRVISNSHNSSFNVILPQFTMEKPFLILTIRNQSLTSLCRMTFSRNASTQQISSP